MLRIAIVVPPMLPVPPVSYAGTERVVASLIDELSKRGHQVTLFAAGDSRVDCELVPTIPRSLWSTGYRGSITAHMGVSIARVWRERERFDIIHSHLESDGFVFARHCPTPVVTTLHGRLDVAGIPDLLAEFTDIPLVAISDSQGRFAPGNNWIATVHHGLDLEALPWRAEAGDYLVFVGRVTPEKGVSEAIELARKVRLPLKIAAKVYDDHEHEHFAEVVKPVMGDDGVEFLGELTPTDRDPLLAGARATLMLGAWPEPFGLVAIESMATGTPVVARRAGALTETVEHGVDGFLIDDLDEAALAVGKVVELDRREIRRRAIERFSQSRMADEYEEVYRQVIESHADRPSGGPSGGNGRRALAPEVAKELASSSS